MGSWKKVMSIALAGAMALQANGMSVLAETIQDQPEETTVKERVAEEEVEIGSSQWETPVIPDAPKTLQGTGKAEISLNETTGDGTWEYLFDIPDYTKEGVIPEDGAPAPDAENQDFDFSKWDNKDWQKIKVPGEPLMQGFDILTNNEYYYRRQITIPEDFAGKQVFVRFDGVYCNARVWINGEYVRTHIGGFTTWDCDITKYAAPGETVTMVVGVADIYASTRGIWNPEGKQVNNPSNATEYAHHNIGGINRDVSLVALDYDYIARTYVNTDFDDTFTDANLEVTAQLGLVSSEAELSVELIDDGKVVASADMAFAGDQDAKKQELQDLIDEADSLLEANKDNLYEGADGKPGQYSKETWEALKAERDAAVEAMKGTAQLSAAKKITIPVESPKKWDAEHPNLYTLRTTLSVDGKAVQMNEENIGFREIHYGGREGTDVNKVYVNGKEVKLRGTCRHDVSDDLGRSMTREEAYQEAAAYKKANINHIRTSHYPASEDLLDACDEYGIYVEQETAVCFQGPWSEVHSRFEDFLPQFTEMVERDRNRPSILIWSLGNESNYNNVKNQSGGNAFQVERDYLKDIETTRPCIFSFPDTGEPAGFADIYSAHYWGVTGGLGKSDRPILHDEFAHIPCYNLDELQRDINVRNFWGESIKRGWEGVFNADGALGCDLWGGIDDVFYIPEGTSERWQSHSDGQTAGYGEWGSVLDAYLREKPEAYLTKKAYSPIRVSEDECYILNHTLYIPVKNWFDHTYLNEIKLEYTVGETTKEIQIAEGIAPHSEGVISVPEFTQNAETVNLKFYTADKKLMIDEYNVQMDTVSYRFTPASEEAPELKEDADAIQILGDDFEVVFSKETGLITNASYQGKTMVTGGPYLHVTGMSLGAWTKDAEGGITAKTEGNYVYVTLKGTYANKQKVTFVVKVSRNGIIDTEYTLTSAPATASGLREVGISYDIAKEAQSVSWLRDGLYSAYPEDHIGRNEGTALKVREGSEETPDQYGVEPKWPWKDDMMNYFVYATDDPNNGIMTNDFKTMREHVWYYNVNYGADENEAHISVEAPNADVAARVECVYDLGYIDDRDASVKYTGGWSQYNSSSDYAGTETYSSRIGDTCELTFQGTGIRFIGSKQNNVGKVKVYLDGEFQEEIDTYSDLGNSLKQSVIYSKDGLADGEHTLKLETSGGHANCIVVDAFEVIKPEGQKRQEKSKLIINQQWYYPNLGWGNYFGKQGVLSNGAKGSASIRLSAQSNLIKEKLTTLRQFRISLEGENQARASYQLMNGAEGDQVTLQWYRVAVGDPDSKAQKLEGETAEILNVAALNANKVYCEATLVHEGVSGKPVRSNEIFVGEDTYSYVDITADSDLFTFEGEKGKDYQTDADKAWTQNAYNKTVTYLMETPNPASITYTFTGSAIRWIGSKENNQGIAEISLDGGTATELDLFDPNVSTGSQVNEVLFEKNWGTPGKHTIKITRSGRKHAESKGTNISLDAFIVIAGSAAAEASIVSNEAFDEIHYAAAAEAVVETTAETTASEAVEAAIVRLSSAIQAFQASRIPEGEEKDIARSLLRTVWTTYRELDKEYYTEESLKALTKTLAEAQAVLNDENATEETMMQAAEAVLAAAAKLKVDTTKRDQDLLDTLAKAQEEVKQAQERLKKAQEEAEQAKEDAGKAQEAVAKAQEEVKKAQEAADKAQEDVRQAQEAADKARKDAQEAVEQANRQASEAIAKAQKEIEEEIAKAQKEAAEAVEKAQKEAAEAVEKAQKEAADAIAAAKKESQDTAAKIIFTSSKAGLKSVKKSGKNAVQVRWKKVASADGYVIQYAANARFKKAKTVTVENGASVQKKIKKLKSGKKYYFRVRAYRQLNGETIFTKNSSKKSLKIK